MFEQDNNIYHSNEVGLFRSLNFLGLIGPKKRVGNYEIGKRLIISGKENPKDKKGYRHPSISHGKLPSISLKSSPILITGNLKLSEMLANPNSPREPKVSSVLL
jgi:hypothetical protein